VNLYPRTWVLRHGPDTGKVLIAFGPTGPLLLVSPDGTTTQQFRLPPTEAVFITRRAEDGAA